jgi:NAD-specific glutamate dehydrogenase
VASGLAPATAARVYGRLGEGTGILWVKRRLAAVEARDPWDRLTLADLRYELLDLQRELTQAILAEKPDDPDEAVDAFVEANAALLDRIRGLVQRAGEGASVGALSVLTARLRELRPRDSTRES